MKEEAKTNTHYILMTTEDIADYVKVHPTTVRTWIRQGRFPALRAGRGWRVRLKDVEEFLAEPHVSPADPAKEAESEDS